MFFQWLKGGLNRRDYYSLKRSTSLSIEGHVIIAVDECGQFEHLDSDWRNDSISSVSEVEDREKQEQREVRTRVEYVVILLSQRQ